VRVPAAEAEVARALMIPLAPSGFEEIELADALELAVYTDAEGAERVAAAFGSSSSTPVEPGWEDRWREFHRPARAGGLWIGPPWESPPADERAVVVDPGRAFGTGSHPTTRACIELLAAQARGSVLDAGCGSGVIAVAAARLGFSPVLAVDRDPVAVEVTLETARRNRAEIEAWAADVLTAELPAVELVVANIELSAVEELLARRPAEVAITSGYLADETPAAPGWERATRLELDGWAADVFRAVRYLSSGPTNAGTARAD
jgi:ribosomal protein L11 methyltransferase